MGSPVLNSCIQFELLYLINHIRIPLLIKDNQNLKASIKIEK